MLRKFKHSHMIFLALFFGLAFMATGMLGAADFQLEATGGSNYIDLKWTNVSADSYEIYRDTDSIVELNNSTLVDIVYNQSTYRDIEVQSDTTYYYQILAIISDNEENLSNVASATVFFKQPHGDYAENPEACAECHQAHTAEGQQLLAETDVNGVCFDCHTSEGPGRDVATQFTRGGSNHPVAVQQCSSCHDGHFSPLDDPALLEVTVSGSVYHTGGGTENCLACHSNFAFDYSGAHNSGQVTPKDAMIACSGCHEPHGSELQWLLKSYPYNAGQSTTIEGNDFCLTCHQNAGQGSDNEWNGEDTYNQGHSSNVYDCNSCHEPHAAPYADYLLRSYYQNYSSKSHSYNSNDYNTCFTLDCHSSGSVLFDGEGHFYDAYQERYLHNIHLKKADAICKECHRPHGEISAENPNLEHLVGFPAGTVSEVVYNGVSEGGPYFQAQSGGGYCLLSCHSRNHDETNSVYSNVYYAPESVVTVEKSVYE